MATELIGAQSVKEVVVKLGELVEWQLVRPDASGVVIYADDRMIFIFDRDEQVLHMLTAGELYMAKPFQAMDWNPFRATVRVQVVPEVDVSMALQSLAEGPDLQKARRMLACATCHLPTQARMLRFIRSQTPRG